MCVTIHTPFRAHTQRVPIRPQPMTPDLSTVSPSPWRPASARAWVAAACALGMAFLAPVATAAGAQAASGANAPTASSAAVVAVAPPAVVGRVVFLAGTAQALSAQGSARALADGDGILAGEQVVTAADSYVHLRMIDQAFVAVRPQSRLSIELYDYDAQKPAASRIRLSLDRGNSRTVSGKGGEAARQGYRFNTPMAAIGLRGTDYTVAALDDATRVSVTRGAVAVTPLGNGCRADALGPCAGPLTRELSATMAHAYLEVNALSRTPQLVRPSQGQSLEPPSGAPSVPPGAPSSSGSSAPAGAGSSGSAPANSAGPSSAGATSAAPASAVAGGTGTAASTGGSTGGTSSTTLGAAQPGATSGTASGNASNTAPTNAAVATAAVVEKVVTAVTQQARPVEVVAPAPVVPPRPAELFWGRWSTYAQGDGSPPMVTLLGPASEIVVGNSVFGLLRNRSTDATLPAQGAFSFKLANAEAYTVAGTTVTPAQVLKGDLSIDFAQRTFATSLDVRHSAGTEQLYAAGQVQWQGLFVADANRSNMKMDGAIVAKGTEAAYVFEKSLTGGGLLGAVRWLR